MHQHTGLLSIAAARISFGILFLLGLNASIPIGFAQLQNDSQISELVQATLSIAAENKSELQLALQQIELEQKPGMDFLLAYMPPADAQNLTSDFLLEHVRGAYVAWRAAPWHQQIPEEIFLNYILPYASVSEKRERWRNDFRERFLPLVKDAKTTSQAAVALNTNLFKQVGVKYSTKRQRADQGPYESIQGGTASCTGLSILLIDACRSVGIPARFAGTPRWSDNSGNHSWVEIWDGEWKYTGAAEPTGDELNRGWFTERASKARTDQPMYSIYAVSYRRTNLKFPLVWKSNFDPVWSINVTDCYLQKSIESDPDQVIARVKVIDPTTSKRVAATLKVKDEQGVMVFEGQSKDESFDANDHLSVPLKKNSKYQAEYQFGTVSAAANIETQDTVSTHVLSLNSDYSAPQPAASNENKTTTGPRGSGPVIDESRINEPLTKEESDRQADLLWKQHSSSLLGTRAQEMHDKLIKLDEYEGLEMKYEFRIFGEKPTQGHALFISMHGGGGTTAKMNDQQWKNQIGLYKPAEGIYVAPRAPTDAWNLWHQKHIDAFFDRLIQNFVLSNEVDPNRVYLMGYSAGGDGVFQLAPRMADRFAAAAMMAGHPNETKPLGLRNLPFAVYMGGKDGAYNRNKLAAQWKEQLHQLREADPTGYEHRVTIYPDKGHWMDREDASALAWMSEHTRDVWPQKMVWHQDDVTHDRLYWLSVPAQTAKERSTITASVKGQTITIESTDVEQFRIWLSDKLLDLDQKIELVINGKSQMIQATRTVANLKVSLESRSDRDMMAPAFIDGESK